MPIMTTAQTSLPRLASSDKGLLSYRSKVNRWECDQNNHWNVRFYVRAFQMAAEAVWTMEGGTNPGLGPIVGRHFRFHRELFSTSPVSVHSAVIGDGDWAGTLVYLLESNGRLSATALDVSRRVPRGVPQVTAEAAKLAIPKGLDGQSHRVRDPSREHGGLRAAELGAVRSGELDHTGSLLMESIMARVTASSHGLLDEIGFTRDFILATGIGRMAVELKMTRHGDCAAGDVLRARSWVASLASKSIAIRHQIEHLIGGAPVATVEQCLVFTDLRTRRAVTVPENMVPPIRALIAGEI